MNELLLIECYFLFPIISLLKCMAALRICTAKMSCMGT